MLVRRRRLYGPAPQVRRRKGYPAHRVRPPGTPTGRPWYPSLHERHARSGAGRHIETDAALPEGAEVVVVTAGDEEPFDLDDAQLAELEARMAEADRGQVEPAAAVLERLRRTR